VSTRLLADLEDIFREVVDLEDAAFQEASMLGRDVPVDSKDMLRILSRIEARYRFRFRPDQVLRLETVGDLVSAIRDAAGGRIPQGHS